MLMPSLALGAPIRSPNAYYDPPQFMMSTSVIMSLIMTLLRGCGDAPSVSVYTIWALPRIMPVRRGIPSADQRAGTFQMFYRRALRGHRGHRCAH